MPSLDRGADKGEMVQDEGPPPLASASFSNHKHQNSKSLSSSNVMMSDHGGKGGKGRLGVHSSSKTTEQMVRSIHLDLGAEPAVREINDSDFYQNSVHLVEFDHNMHDH